MKKVSMIALGLLAAAQVHAAAASDGTINFTGEIKGQTCKVSLNGGDSTGTVTLPTVAASMLKDEGQTAGTTRFTINLTECATAQGETATGDVYAYFEQGANVNADGRLTNQGTAANVDLQLLDNANQVVNVGSSVQSTSPTTATLDDAGAATLTYSAQYYSTGGAGSGSVASSVTYSINYL